MPVLSNIVAQVNTDLQTVFTGAKFQKGSFNGIVELNKSSADGETKPGIVANNGKVTKVTPKTEFPFLLYHRTINLAYPVSPDDFGDKRTIREVAEMKGVILADRERIQDARENLVAGVAFGMPKDFTDTFKQNLSLLDAQIDFGDFELDRSTVWSDEFGISQELFKTNTVLFAWTYTITTEMLKSCFTLCN